MPNFNELIVTPKTGFIVEKITLNPSTVLDPGPQFETQKVNTMTVANGSTVQVYDVTDPSNPVLIGTVG